MNVLWRERGFPITVFIPVAFTRWDKQAYPAARRTGSMEFVPPFLFRRSNERATADSHGPDLCLISLHCQIQRLIRMRQLQLFRLNQ